MSENRRLKRKEAEELKKREERFKNMTPPQMSAANIRTVYAHAATICKKWSTEAIALVTLYELTNKIKLDINAFADAPEQLEYAEGHNNMVTLMYLNWEGSANSMGSEFVPLDLVKRNVDDVVKGLLGEVETVADKGAVEAKNVGEVDK